MVALRNIHTAGVDGVPPNGVVEVADPARAARMMATKLFVDASRAVAPQADGVRVVARSTADDESAMAAAARDREERNALARAEIDGAVGTDERPPSADDLRAANDEIERLRGLLKERDDELALARKSIEDANELLDETGKQVADLEAKLAEKAPAKTEDAAESPKETSKKGQ
jgi:hypothetical protein